MARRYALRVLPVAALVGFAVSAWLLVMYQTAPGAMACGPGGGCHTVRMCKLASVGGVSWPFIGVVAFGILLAASLSTREVVRRWLPWMGVVAAFTGAALFVLQKLVCGAFCPYCLVADSAGIVAGLASWLGRGPAVAAEFSWVNRRVQLAAGGLALLSLGGAMMRIELDQKAQPVVGRREVRLPEPIAREQREGVVTIVEFADFECPHCRRQHEEMAGLLASYGSRVRLVRKHVPLSFHRHAMDAARAACCAEEQGRSEAMADALLRTDPNELTPAGCEQIASRLGLDVQAFRACMSAPRTNERIQHDRDDALASGVEGLPTTFVADERFEGVVPASTLRASIDRALRSSTQGIQRPRG